MRGVARIFWVAALASSLLMGPVLLGAATIRFRGVANRVKSSVSSGAISAPTEISGCVLWLDGNDTAKLWQDSGGTVAVAADGDPVRLWQDKSGAGNHGTAAADANRPLYKTGVLGGKAVLLFDGTDDYFNLVNGFTGLTAGEVFAVARKQADPAVSSAKSGFWGFGSDATAEGEHVPFTDNNVYSAFGTDARKTVGNPATTLAQWNLIDVRSASGAWSWNLNTGSVFSTGVNTVGWRTTPRVGVSMNGGALSYYMDGWFAEVIIYNSVLSAGDRAKVEQYLKTKWGLTTY